MTQSGIHGGEKVDAATLKRNYCYQIYGVYVPPRDADTEIVDDGAVQEKPTGD